MLYNVLSIDLYEFTEQSCHIQYGVDVDVSQQQANPLSEASMYICLWCLLGRGKWTPKKKKKKELNKRCKCIIVIVKIIEIVLSPSPTINQSLINYPPYFYSP